MLGLNHRIRYRKGKENKVADALYKRNMQVEEGCQGNQMEGGRFTAITQITPSWYDKIPSWYDKIYASYKDDVMLQDIMRSKLVDAAQSPSFTYADGVVKYKGRVVIGSAG